MINKKRFAPTLAIILVLMLVGGTSVYAEKAVPGDLLYGIKVGVNESAAGLFAVSKEEKTEWQERLVERRLDEAYRLSFQDNLNEATRVELEKRIKNEIDSFTANVNELALRNGESIHSSDLNIRLQAALKAYQNVLEKLSGDTTIGEDTRNETGKFISILEESHSKVKRDHENLALNVGVDSQSISSVSTTSSISSNSTSALTKQSAAESVLASMKLSYQKEKIKLSINIQDQINNKLALAEATLQEGKAFISSADYINATSKFQTIINLVNEAKLLMLSNIMKDDIEDDEDIDD
jgi:hypothetical protein